jgi:hypothetical protein
MLTKSPVHRPLCATSPRKHGLRALKRARVVAALGAAAFALGCTNKVPQINSRLSDPELKERLTANFHKGMTLPEVNERLSALDVPLNVRHAYAGSPPQLLVRLFPTGTFWVKNAEYQRTRYVDAWFVFTPESGPTLSAIDLEGHEALIQAGTYINPPFHNPSLLPREARPVPPDVGVSGREWITTAGMP